MSAHVCYTLPPTKPPASYHRFGQDLSYKYFLHCCVVIIGWGADTLFIPHPTRRLWHFDARAFGASIVVPPDTKSWRRHWSPPLFKVKLPQWTPSRTHTQHGYTPCAGAQAPPLLGPRSRKPSPTNQKFTTTPLITGHLICIIGSGPDPNISLTRQGVGSLISNNSCSNASHRRTV